VAESGKILSRAEIDPKYTWNAESVYTSVDAWQAEFARMQQALPTLQQYVGKLNDSAALADALELSMSLAETITKLYVYASMSSAVDTSDQGALALQGQVIGLFAQYSANAAFIEPELIALGEARVNEMIASEPRLAIYKQYAHNLFRRQAHVRSAEVEELLGTVGEALGGLNQAFTMLSNADLKFPAGMGKDGSEYDVVQGNIITLMSTLKDREARRTAWNNYHDEYLAHKNTFSALYAGQLKTDVFYAA
jgi:oligoendopeptidase F